MMETPVGKWSSVPFYLSGGAGIVLSRIVDQRYKAQRKALDSMEPLADLPPS